MGLATSSLSICEDGCIISIENILYKRKWGLFVDFLLRGILAEDIIIGKVFDGGSGGSDFFKSDLMCDFIDDDDVFTVWFKIEKNLGRIPFDSWDDNVPWPWQIQSCWVYSVVLLLYCLI